MALHEGSSPVLSRLGTTKWTNLSNPFWLSTPVETPTDTSSWRMRLANRSAARQSSTQLSRTTACSGSRGNRQRVWLSLRSIRQSSHSRDEEVDVEHLLTRDAVVAAGRGGPNGCTAPRLETLRANLRATPIDFDVYSGRGRRRKSGIPEGITRLRTRWTWAEGGNGVS